MLGYKGSGGQIGGMVVGIDYTRGGRWWWSSRPHYLYNNVPPFSSSLASFLLGFLTSITSVSPGTTGLRNLTPSMPGIKRKEKESGARGSGR